MTSSLCGAIDRLTELAAFLRSEAADIHIEHVADISANPHTINLQVIDPGSAFKLADALGLTGLPAAHGENFIHHTYTGRWRGHAVHVSWLEHIGARRNPLAGVS